MTQACSRWAAVRAIPQLRPAVVVLYGALSPAHLGHTAALRQAVSALETNGFTVLGAWLAPWPDAAGSGPAFRTYLAQLAAAEVRSQFKHVALVNSRISARFKIRDFRVRRCRAPPEALGPRSTRIHVRPMSIRLMSVALEPHFGGCFLSDGGQMLISRDVVWAIHTFVPRRVGILTLEVAGE